MVSSVESPSAVRSGIPEGITAGPDGELWFTNSGTDSLGKITTHGVGDTFLEQGHFRSVLHHFRSRRRDVVHELREQFGR